MTVRLGGAGFGVVAGVEADGMGGGAGGTFGEVGAARVVDADGDDAAGDVEGEDDPDAELVMETGSLTGLATVSDGEEQALIITGIAIANSSALALFLMAKTLAVAQDLHRHPRHILA